MDDPDCDEQALRRTYARFGAGQPAGRRAGGGPTASCWRPGSPRPRRRRCSTSASAAATSPARWPAGRGPTGSGSSSTPSTRTRGRWPSSRDRPATPGVTFRAADTAALVAAGERFDLVDLQPPAAPPRRRPRWAGSWRSAPGWPAGSSCTATCGAAGRPTWAGRLAARPAAARLLPAHRRAALHPPQLHPRRAGRRRCPAAGGCGRRRRSGCSPPGARVAEPGAGAAPGGRRQLPGQLRPRRRRRRPAVLRTGRARWVHHALYVSTATLTARGAGGRGPGAGAAPAGGCSPSVVPLAVVPYAGTALAAAPRRRGLGRTLLRGRAGRRPASDAWSSSTSSGGARPPTARSCPTRSRRSTSGC